MLRVGLTGGIACGKSHVLARLASAGFHTLDLDAVAHEVLSPGGPSYAEVVAAFGGGILAADGTIGRKALASLVFADPEARSRLNAIVHPRVREVEARRAAAHAGQPGAVVVSDAALLIEAGVHLRFDRLVVVHCGEEPQLRRLMARDGISEEAARARVSAQMPVAEKRRFAHFEVDSSGSLADTARATGHLAGRLRAVAAARGAASPVPLEQALGCLLHGPSSGPRGLTPVLLLHEIAAAGGLEMERLARLLVPAAEGPWYRAARPREPGRGPESLVGPLVLWALARSSPDPPFLLAAAASLARLTHLEPEAVATACVFARALQEVAVHGRVPEDLAGTLPAWSAEAERWGGAAPSASLSAVFEAALRHPRDVEAARRACERPGGDPALAAALVGLATGAVVDAAPAALLPDLRALETIASGAP